MCLDFGDIFIYNTAAVLQDQWNKVGRCDGPLYATPAHLKTKSSELL